MSGIEILQRIVRVAIQNMKHHRQGDDLGSILSYLYGVPGIVRDGLHGTRAALFTSVRGYLYRYRRLSPTGCGRRHTPVGRTGNRPGPTTRYLHNKLVLALIESVRFFRFHLYHDFFARTRDNYRGDNRTTNRHDTADYAIFYFFHIHIV